MQDTDNAKAVRCRIIDNNMRLTRMQAHSGIEFLPYSRHFGKLCQQGKHIGQRIDIGVCLIQPPAGLAPL